ncbi:MAG: cytochrome C oxidase subunit IV family protein [Planctomycetota bacterium]|nr:cytochrome C oxidase subunit IV family protein [Planctomycetota bacterium]
MSAADVAEHEHHGTGLYWKIFGALTVLTVVEILWAGWFGSDAFIVLVLGLGLMAGTKALLVALYYMHLKQERALIYILVVTPLVLVLIMILGFLPDAIWDLSQQAR